MYRCIETEARTKKETEIKVERGPETATETKTKKEEIEETRQYQGRDGDRDLKRLREETRQNQGRNRD